MGLETTTEVFIVDIHTEVLVLNDEINIELGEENAY